jgi:hypothetical protein
MFLARFYHLQAMSLHQYKLQLHFNYVLAFQVLLRNICCLSEQNYKNIKLYDISMEY